MSEAEKKLEDSKDRLRSAFARLEGAVDKRISVVEARARTQVANAQSGGDVSVIRQEIDQMKKQATSLEAEKTEVQNLLNQEKVIVQKLKTVNQEASSRVDGILGELKQLIKE